MSGRGTKRATTESKPPPSKKAKKSSAPPKKAAPAPAVPAAVPAAAPPTALSAKSKKAAPAPRAAPAPPAPAPKRRLDIGKSINRWRSKDGKKKAKPVIYLRAPRALDACVEVRLSDARERFSSLLPRPADYCGAAGARLARWRVRAQPDGTLLPPRGAPAGAPAVSSLFWESVGGDVPGEAAGAGGAPWFAVRGREGGDWLLRALALQGLSVREATEMAQFWGPKMGRHEWVEARFLPQRELEAAAPLSVAPRPDATLRVFLLLRRGGGGGSGGGGGGGALAGRLPPAPPAATAFAAARANADAFTVVEWGGCFVE